MTPQKFLSIYRSLPERLKALIRLKALLYFKIPTETWKACFYQLAYLFPTKTPLSISEFNTMVNELRTKKLIDREEMIPSGMNHVLTLEALQSGHAKQYLDAIETVAAQITYRFYSQSTFEGNTIEFNLFRLAIYTREDNILASTSKIIPPLTSPGASGTCF